MRKLLPGNLGNSMPGASEKLASETIRSVE